MIYGTITSLGFINNGAAFSNNYWVTQTGDGAYTITLTQWASAEPTVIVTPMLPQVTASCTVSKNTNSGLYEISISLYQGNRAMDCGFYFQAMYGRSLVFDVSQQPNKTITFTPTLQTYGSTLMLVLTTTLQDVSVGGIGTSLEVGLDCATSLYGFNGTPLTLELSASTVSDDRGNTWTLQGYTYGAGFGDTGTPWNGRSTTLSVDPQTQGPVTALERLVVKGLPATGNQNTSVLATDPIVRLSSVPPGYAVG